MSGNAEGADRPRDRRTQRTRTALLQAFSRLAASRRFEDISAADIAEAADVGRSTLYEHFTGRDGVYREAMRGPFGMLADSIVGESDPEALVRLLEHFWENRAFARSTIARDQGRQAARLLTDLLADRLSDGPAVRIVATQLAECQLGLLRAWTAGEVSGSPAELAAAIRDASRALIAAAGCTIANAS